MTGEQVADTVVKVKGASTGVGFLGSVLIFLFKEHWRITISVILLLFTLTSSIFEAAKEHSFAPIIFNIGDKIAFADQGQYKYLKDIEKNNWRFPSTSILQNEPNGFWKDLKSALTKISFVWNVIETCWWIYVITYMFYWIFKITNTGGAIAFNVILAIFVVVMLEMGYCAFMLYINYDCSVSYPEKCLSAEDKYFEVAVAATPLKSFIFIGMNWNDLINAFKYPAVAYAVETNQTNSTF